VSNPTSRLTDQQIQVLFGELHKSRVGFNQKGFAHVQQWDVRRFLIRVFGFGGYDTELVSIDCVREIPIPSGKDGNGNDKFRWTVVYRVHQRLTVKDIAGNPIATYDGVATGDAQNQPSLGDAHDGAVKEADSQSLKRAAVNLGDSFGLSLYNGGASRDGASRPVVLWSAAHLPQTTTDTGPSAVPDAREDDPVLPEPDARTSEPEPDTPPVAHASTAPAGAPPVQGPPPALDGEDPDDREAALAEMWDAAQAAAFTDGLPAQFTTSFGHPIEQGTIAEIRQARDLMLGSVAA
jgi:hypothetical protein